MQKSKLWLLLPLAGMLLAGCSQNKFNPYRHISTIMSIKSQEQYDVDENYILSHTAPDLRESLAASLQGTIYDPNYSITAKNVFIQEAPEITKLILEYDYSSSEGLFTKVVYCEYNSDQLVDYNIIQTAKNMFE